MQLWVAPNAVPIDTQPSRTWPVCSMIVRLYTTRLLALLVGLLLPENQTCSSLRVLQQKRVYNHSRSSVMGLSPRCISGSSRPTIAVWYTESLWSVQAQLRLAVSALTARYKPTLWPGYRVLWLYWHQKDIILSHDSEARESTHPYRTAK